MESKVERVVLETRRYRIAGDLTMPREGYRSRLTDYLNQGELDFIALVNVLIAPLDGGADEARDFVAVSRAGVELAYPAAEPPPPPSGR